MKRIIWTALVVAGLVAMVVVKSIMNFAAEEASRDAFNAAAAEYIDFAYPDSQESAPYISGKLVTIDVTGRKADYWTYPKLPPDLRAGTPDEVGTVALIRWEKKLVGYYEDAAGKKRGGDAFQAVGNVTLVDWRQKRIIDRKTFVGDKPVEAKRDEADYMAWWPMFDVVEYLKALPRQ